MQTQKIINFGSNILKNKLISSHRLDSELILSEILKIKREELLIRNEELHSSQVFLDFKKLINRRASREPMAYILEKKGFWKNNFIVDRNTLIPRPETELLIELVSKKFKNKDIFILDVGTGSGCIILSLLEELKSIRGVGIDISKKAIEIAKKNAKMYKNFKRIKFLNRDINQIYNKKFDLIISNPPYISTHQIKNLSEDIKRYEPRIALNGGNDGLDVVRKVIYKSKSILRKNGFLALEIGFGQHNKVSQILKLNGFIEKILIKDYQKNVRCIFSIIKQ
tara:strand:+ start:1093 stop:1935 length:843 start_codon:yes stop_codon:yes gene_type:complete